MDRIVLGKKIANKHRPRVDRFVPPRDSIPDIKMRLFTARNSDDNLDIWYSRYLQQKKYTKYLDRVYGIDSINNTIDGIKGIASNDYSVQPWPCAPRKKNYLKTADSILDLPTYSYAIFPELLDWSNVNVLVAALGRHYHKWSWQTQNLMCKGCTRYEIRCCKFDPRGELLALGTENEIIEIHDNVLNKCVAQNSCCCDGSGFKCFISAVDWSPTGNSFITGCSRGTLTSYTRDAKLLNTCRLNTAVFSIKVSPDARYVAAAVVNGFEAIIMSWPDLKFYSSLYSNWTIKTITWHPWKSALLSVGTSTSEQNAHIVICNVPTFSVQEMTIGRNHYSLDAMLFSHRTGELVMSLWDTDDVSRSRCSQLVVMSDLNTVVDQWGEGQTGLERIRTMIFSPDGTKLATATIGEDLVIWNFLPDDNKRKYKRKKHHELPVYLDVTTHGYSLR